MTASPQRPRKATNAKAPARTVDQPGEQESPDSDNQRGDSTGPLKNVPLDSIPEFASLASWLALTDREQKFIVAYSRHRKRARAAHEAGVTKTNASMAATRWLAKPAVQACLVEIASRAALAAELNLTAHMTELARLRDGAKSKGDYSPAVRAEELRGKAAGFYKDIVEFRPGQDLDDGELASRIASLTGEPVDQVKARMAARPALVRKDTAA